MSERRVTTYERPSQPEDVSGGFEAFFEEANPRLFRAMCLLTHDPTEAEDLCQIAFFKVWERWDRVVAMENPSGYLYRTALNTYRKGYRRAVLRATYALKMQPADDPELTLEAHDTVTRWFDELTPRQRTAVVLTETAALPIAGVARVMRIEPATVYALLSQARTALKRAMETPDG